MNAIYEKFRVGDKIAPLKKGPVSTSHIMRWSAAIENWHRIHYDYPFATKHEGLPEILINGSWKQHVLVQLIKDTIGHDAWLWKLSFRYRAPDLAGEVLVAKGVITEKKEIDGIGFLSINVTMEKSDGIVSTEGSAVAVVPFDGGSVPYPFKPTPAQTAHFSTGD